MTDIKQEIRPDDIRSLLEYVTRNTYKVRENDIQVNVNATAVLWRIKCQQIHMTFHRPTDTCTKCITHIVI